jgi:hypothetical protein
MNKRSEVVNLIESLIAEENSGLDYSTRAHNLLGVLEEYVGMQPPSRTYQKEFEEYFESIHYKVVRDVTDNTWEPEDDNEWFLKELSKGINLVTGSIVRRAHEDFEKIKKESDIQFQIGRLLDLANDLDSLPIEAVKYEVDLLNNEKNIFIAIMGEDEYNKLNRVFRAKHVELESEMIDDLNDIQKRGW